jgi:hypothetical protein
MGRGEGDEAEGMEFLEEGRIDGVVGAGSRFEEAEADGKPFMEAGEGGEVFIEVAGEDVLRELFMPFFEVADVTEAATFEKTKCRRAEA